MIKNNLHSVTYGTGQPIYFIHGLALDLTSMLETYEEFFEDNSPFRRVYLDLPGMGHSLIEESTQTSDDILSLLKAFIINDAKEESFVLCGHSYGGYLAMALAYLFPDQTEKIFLTCPVVKATSTERTIEAHHKIIEESVEPTENHDYFEDFLSMNVAINQKSWRNYQERIIPGLKRFNASFWNQLQEEHYILSFEEELLTNFPMMKGMLLLGKLDHVVGYKDQLTYLSEKVETVTLLENAGHNLPIDCPLLMKEYWEKFLE